MRNAYKIGALAIAGSLALAACGGNDNPPPDTGDMAGGAQPDMTTNTNNGPKIISLGTNVNQLTSGESVRFVAVVTDPSGLQNLVGGQLVSPDGTIKYGAFIASQQGSYNLDLSWSAINQAQGINFAASESRTFVAEFYNTAAQKSSQAITLKLHCDLNGMTRGACNGVCSAEGATCGGGGGRICVAGACGLGCYIGKMLVKPDAANPSNSCQSCQPTQLTSDWSNLPEDTSCGAGVYCRTGTCVVRFQRRIGAGAALFSGNLNAITPIAAKTAFAVNSNGAIFHWRKTLIELDRNLFERLIQREGLVGYRLCKILAQRRREIENKLENLVFKDVNSKLAELLLRLATEYGVDDSRGTLVALKITHQEMANLIGSTRETVSLTLSQFKRSGLIKTDGRKVILSDREGLRALA